MFFLTIQLRNIKTISKIDLAAYLLRFVFKLWNGHYDYASDIHSATYESIQWLPLKETITSVNDIHCNHLFNFNVIFWNLSLGSINKTVIG